MNLVNAAADERFQFLFDAVQKCTVQSHRNTPFGYAVKPE